MLRQSLQPLRATVRSSLRHRAARYTTETSPKQSTNPLIPILGVGAVVIGGIVYFGVPLKHDLADRAADAKQGQAKPSTLRAGDVRTDVKTSVLDQDSLKKPLHKASDGATPSLLEEKKKSSSSPVPETVEKKAEEAKEPAQSAFNEETGEINWDCPCLGGMADGPCGEQFKAAFSCFVYSEQEPKGVECVDKFKAMQDCFREHPDVYGEEIDDDEDTPAPASDDVKSDSDSSSATGKKEFKPEPVKRTPPPNNPVLATTPETTPSKGVSKLVPTSKRADKGPGGVTPPIGEGTVPAPGSPTDKKDEHKEVNAN